MNITISFISTKLRSSISTSGLPTTKLPKTNRKKTSLFALDTSTPQIRNPQNIIVSQAITADTADKADKANQRTRVTPPG